MKKILLGILLAAALIAPAEATLLSAP